MHAFIYLGSVIHVYREHSGSVVAEAEGNFVVACLMFVVETFVLGPAFVIRLYASFLVWHYSPLGRTG